MWRCRRRWKPRQTYVRGRLERRWHGTAGHGMVRYGMVWYGMVWYMGLRYYANIRVTKLGAQFGTSHPRAMVGGRAVPCPSSVDNRLSTAAELPCTSSPSVCGRKPSILIRQLVSVSRLMDRDHSAVLFNSANILGVRTKSSRRRLFPPPPLSPHPIQTPERNGMEMDRVTQTIDRGGGNGRRG